MPPNKGAMLGPGAILLQTTINHKPRLIRSRITKPRVIPPIHRRTRISSNQRLHRRRDPLRHHTLRTTPKRRQKPRGHTNPMIRPSHLTQILQPRLIQKRTTPSLLRIRIKNHQIKIITLISEHLNQPSEHVIHVLRRRRMQRNHQERVTISPTPIPQRPATRRPWSHSVLHRRQPQPLRLRFQNKPFQILIQEEFDPLIQWPARRHNRRHRETVNTFRRRHEIWGHSFSHKALSSKGVRPN